MNYLKQHLKLTAWLITTLLVGAAIEITGAKLDFWPQFAVILAVIVAVYLMLRLTIKQ